MQVVPNILDLDCDERFWVPQSKDVWFRPLLFSVSQGYFVNILKVRKSGILSRHRHAGPVHATVLRGRWHYLEHPWWAEEGSKFPNPTFYPCSFVRYTMSLLLHYCLAVGIIIANMYYLEKAMLSSRQEIFIL